MTSSDAHESDLPRDTESDPALKDEDGSEWAEEGGAVDEGPATDTGTATDTDE